jgi:hypothetical protein
VEVVVEPEPVLAEDVFADIFQNATRVDRVSIDDIKDCRVVSRYDVKVGDIVSVEVVLARREDSSSDEFKFGPYYEYIRDSSGATQKALATTTLAFKVAFFKGDSILGNDAERDGGYFRLARGEIANPWNEAIKGPGRISVYRGRTADPVHIDWLGGMVRVPTPIPNGVGSFVSEDSAIGHWIPKWGALVPGTYTVGFVPNEKVSGGYSTPGDPNLAYCKQMQRSIDVANLIPDSVLIAWYVN